MKEIAPLLAVFVLIGLTWRKFGIEARLALLGAIVVLLIVFMIIKVA